MAYQYGPCSPRRQKREVVYFRYDVRIRQKRAGSDLWFVQTLNEYAGTWSDYNLNPESRYDAECRARYALKNN